MTAKKLLLGVSVLVLIAAVGLGAILWQPYPSREAIADFEQRYPQLPLEGRESALQAFLLGLNGDDSADELGRATGLDAFMVERYRATRDHAIVAAYAHNNANSAGTAAYRMCGALEQFWAIDGYGQTLERDPAGAQFLKRCLVTGAWGDYIKLWPDAGTQYPKPPAG